MKTDLTLKQMIHPNYYLSPSELQMFKEFYGVKGEVNAEMPRQKLNMPYLKMVTVGFCCVLLSFLTLEGASEKSEATAVYETRKEIEAAPSLNENYEEVSQNLTHLTDVVSFLLESEKSRNSEPSSLNEPKAPLEEEKADLIVTVIKDKTPLKENHSNNSKTLRLLGKDSKLILQEEINGWVQVTSPKGLSAWISKDFIRLG